MSFKENGLDIVIFPPGGEKIAPNGNIKTRINITNKHYKAGVRLEVSLDFKPELQKWCKNRNHKITIGYLQSQEIEFLWDIPLQATPGTYNYNLKIQFLRSNSFYYFKPKRRQLTILPTIVKPQINSIEPSFAITPVSSSTKPITLSPRETLNLEIDVHNRSNRTDNFRLSTDLENPWYIIRYPETIKRVGAIDVTNALDLNPGEKGKINLKINPPTDTIAGNYKPEIKLQSLNSPELFLKKIIYLDIPPKYLLQVELETILNKVSYKKGQYKIILTNQGNTFRAINIQAKSSDEDECCDYFLEKSSVRIPPNKTVEVKLEVQPKSKQKRPLLTTKQFNFQVNLIDANNHPLPKNSTLKSSLIWRSRPLWQLILSFAVALSIISGCTWMIWRFLIPQDPKIILFESEETEYQYGDKVAVKWEIENFKTIDKIFIFDNQLGKNHDNTQCYLLNNKDSNDNCIKIHLDNTPDDCQINNNKIGCSNIIFNHAQAVQDYTFKMEAIKNNKDTIEQETKTTISPRTTFDVIEPLTISPDKSEYKPTDNLELKFEVSNIKSLKEEDKISLLIDNKRQETSKNIKEFCIEDQNTNDRYQCTIKIPPLSDGEYNLELEVEYDPDGLIETESKKISVPNKIIVQTPIKFDYFKINGKSNTQIEVEPNIPITVSWSVIGKEVKANISCIPDNIRSSGRKIIEVLPGKSQSCTLTASDIHGASINPKTITVFVKEPPKKPELEKTKPSQTIIKRPFGL